MSRTEALRRYLQERHITVSGPQEVDVLADELRFESPCVIQADMALASEVHVGAYTGIFGGRLRHVRVGRYCSIARDFNSGWDDHPLDRITSSMISYVPDVHGWAGLNGVDVEDFRRRMVKFRSIKGITEIGHDVWIGHGVFIAAGVRVGHGAVIAARSVVTKDVEAYEIVAGVPAKRVRFRFDEALIERCLKAQWWRYNIFRYGPEVMAEPERFLDALERDVERGAVSDACGSVVSGADLRAVLS